ncbi:MAG: alpha/beta hydrolase [Alphaproteobacteria bacterium]|nr:alpha/beta hydrolase [Alphaproteobacteria bacterium]
MTLHPGAQAVLDLIAEAGRPSFEEMSVPDCREAYVNSRKALQPEPIDIPEIRNLTMPGPAGDIGLRLYRGQRAEPGVAQPVIVYFHGGGWVIGDLESHDTICRELAHRANVTLISVDYRLAPEHVFPAAVEDAIAATAWISENAAELGVDPKRLAVAGDSAGGNLAAVAAIAARDNGGPDIAFQALIYPVTDFDLRRPSYEENGHRPPVKTTTMAWFRDLYLRGPEDEKDWRAAPIHAASLAHLPPAYVMTAGYDPLRDDGRAYADALTAAGTACRYRCFDGQIHGFLNMARVNPQTFEAFDEIAGVLRTALA